jgi:signal transduction histidine kinase
MILNLINDLLDMAKMENHSFILNSNYFNLFEIIEQSLQNIGFQAKQKHITLEHEYLEDQAGYFL